LMGTPLYMSPEQCLGVREVDQRTDIYSLGCILYEMLCGGPPFVSEGFGALINMHINQPPEPPSRLNRDVKPAVEKAVLRMLAKTPGERFASMAEVRAALTPLIAGAPGTSRPGTTPSASSSYPTVPAAGLSNTTLSASAISSSGLRGAVGASTALLLRKRRVVGVSVVVGGLALGTALFLAARPRVPRAAAGPVSASVSTATPTLSPTPMAAPTPTSAPTPTPTTTVPAAPSPPAGPATVEVVLESDPPGALVTADGVAIGTTPTAWRAPEGSAPVTLSFALDGYKREVIKAVPSHGLRLAPTLKKASTHRSSTTAKRAAVVQPPDDIKSER